MLSRQKKEKPVVCLLVIQDNFSIGSKVTYDKLNLMNSKERVDVSREVYENGLVSAHSLQPVGYEKLVSEYLLEKISYDEF